MRDRRLSKEARRWWATQRLHGLTHAYRQQCASDELNYLAKRLRTPGGIAKLKRLLTGAIPKEYQVAQ